ncbi:ABC transporter nucleotide binding/ATPase (sugar) [Nitratireductor indicus C115]|uniref:ABC transporter nucleotide binding/ATPase (Sugar) n=1 Tax=Nitratireductor indicus C115 TaxID=1231190 RepID=K2PSV1_9HYPH|nr:sn-glycerol-3-phosphate ABC transporter ATP-binding protein UgpC [Nitratireductor indicus]EKF44162.1 ABC transporter nucleotide binding/ATPase (sugar) [Nitratireductor indicus C115]SFQ24493.1 multiple sugar transport system ATP-binding protein [Nitratireductor indicus]
MAAIALENIVKRFGTFEVIKSIDLKIREGEFVVLVGPSGCGKSTLLRLLAGLEDASEGTITIGDRQVQGLPPQQRNIAMVFQNYALYPHYTVEQNMGFGLRLRSMPKDQIKAKVHEAARILGLEDYLARYPKNLSGGQRQRVAMGRAIVRDPDVYLFDEPLSNLDAKLRIAMRTEIKALHQRLGRTTVYVTHDQVEAMTMADRIVILRQGEIAQQGTPMELYNTPADRFVAGFIGAPTMNFLDGRIEPCGSGSTFRFANGEHLPLGAGAREAREAVAGIRPEHLSVGAPVEQGQGLNGRVSLIEPTGPSDYLLVETNAGTVTVVAASGAAQLNEQIGLTANESAWHLFEPGENGRRI